MAPNRLKAMYRYVTGLKKIKWTMKNSRLILVVRSLLGFDVWGLVGGAQHPQCTGPGDGSQQGQAVVHHQLQRRREGASQLPPGQLLLPVLRIHDILGWIRIRIWIRRSMPLTNGSGCGSGSCYFRQWRQRSFFAYYFLKVHLHHFSKIKSNTEFTEQ